MMLVRHAMAASPVTATPDLSASDAAGLIASHDIGALPIVEGERLVGSVTDRDLVLRVLASRKDPRSVRLRDIATSRELATVTPDTQLCDAREISASFATEETNPGPDVGTGARAHQARGLVGAPHTRTWRGSRSRAPSVRLPRQLPAFLRSFSSDWDTRRETCICEMPSWLAISVCVRPSKNRR
jgi:CBS domain-containing protein